MTTSATRPDRRAFVLMELMLVLLIMAMLAAVVYPSARALWKRLRAESAQSELVGLLRQARWWSARTGKTCLVRLTSSDEEPCAEVRYIDDVDGTPAVLKAYWTRLEQQTHIVSLAKLPDKEIAGETQELTVVFSPQGVTSDYVIGLSPVSGESVQIEIRRPSGLVWLARPDSPDSLFREQLASIDDYWQGHCRNAVGTDER